MIDRPTQEELDKVYSEEGKLSDQIKYYPFVFSLFKGDLSRKINLADGIKVSEYRFKRDTYNYIVDFAKGEILSKHIKIFSKVSATREVLKVNTKKYLAESKRIELELEEATDSLNLYGLLKSIQKEVSPEEWKRLLDEGEDYILKFYPKVLKYNFIERDGEDLKYNFNSFDMLLRSVFREAIIDKFSLKIGVDGISEIIEENNIRTFLSDGFISVLDEARGYMKEEEERFTKAEERIEKLLKSIPLTEEDEAIVSGLIKKGESFDDELKTILSDKAQKRGSMRLRDYVDELRNLKIKKSDNAKFRKQILNFNENGKG